MRPLALVTLALLVAPMALMPSGLAHGGSHGLLLRDVVLVLAPGEVGQRLRFEVDNEPTSDATHVKAHIALRDSTMRETQALPPIPAGGTATIDLPLVLRIAPRACVVVTAAGAKASEEVCAYASGIAVPMVPAASSLPSG